MLDERSDRSVGESVRQGAITRREFVAAIAVLASGGPAAAQAPKSQLPVPTLNHVTLYVSSVEPSVKFYQDLFGMPVMSRQDNGIDLAAGDSFVGIYTNPAGGANPPHINHFCLGVERFDGDQTMKVCAEHGVEGRIRMRGDVKDLYLTGSGRDLRPAPGRFVSRLTQSKARSRAPIRYPRGAGIKHSP